MRLLIILTSQEFKYLKLRHSIQCLIKHYNPQDYEGVLDENGNTTGEVIAQDLGTWQDWVNFYFANQNFIR